MCISDIISCWSSLWCIPCICLPGFIDQYLVWQSSKWSTPCLGMGEKVMSRFHYSSLCLCYIALIHCEYNCLCSPLSHQVKDTCSMLLHYINAALCANITMKIQCYPEVEGWGMTLFPQGYIGHIAQHTGQDVLSHDPLPFILNYMKYIYKQII